MVFCLIWQEEMSELRGLIRLKKKERCSLEVSLVARRCQDSAGAAMAQSLREELEDRRAEQQVLSFLPCGLISIRA